MTIVTVASIEWGSAASAAPFVLGALSVIAGTAMLMLRNDVTGRLAAATVAQKGYLAMQCGLGAFGHAVFHTLMPLDDYRQQLRTGAIDKKQLRRALQCGACGGHDGGHNARVMAAILNRPQIRARLAAGGIVIPDDTLFVAARHDTKTDTVTLFNRDRLPASHRDDLDELEAALARAGNANRARRGTRMNTGAGQLAWRSRVAAELRPEWGLARNAAFIVAPRERTLGAPLDGCAFLHSYDRRIDADGGLLETIMTAPMIVAQWINSQYYFSTVDNATYGSGSKTTQNVVGGCAIMQGNQSDLRLGLPLQSVRDENGSPFHEPQRLLVLVEAPLDKVTGVIEKHEQVARLFDNEWLMLTVLYPGTGHVYRYQPGGYWHSEAVASAA